MQRESTIKGTILRYPAHYRDQLNIIVSDASDVIEDDNFEEAVGLVGEKVRNQAGVTDEEICKYILPYVELPEDLEAEDSIGNMLQGTMKEIIDEILKSLNERERFVLELRYGFIDNQERTLEEVGNILHVTRERVRQIEAKALRKINASRKVRILWDYL